MQKHTQKQLTEIFSMIVAVALLSGTALVGISPTETMRSNELFSSKCIPATISSSSDWNQ